MLRSSRISSGSTSRVPLGIGWMVGTPAGAAPVGSATVTESVGVDALAVLDALDARPERAQALVDPLVAAVDLADVADLGGAVGAQRGDQHRHARADVRRLEPFAAQAARADDERAMGVADRDRGTHQLQLVGEEEAVLEHLLVDDDRALRL